VTAVHEVGEPFVCALEIQERFAVEDWGQEGRLRIRVGLHVGEAELQAVPGPDGGD
jgi:hypothetical protein